MSKTRIAAREAAEDLFFGQIVIIWARWFFIATAAILILWSAETSLDLSVGILLIAAMMGVNFFIHGRYLVKKPANRLLTLLTSLLDLFMITLVVLLGPGRTGLDSQFFIFYYPLFFAFALVFPPHLAVAYTFIAVCGYAAACFLVDPAFVASAPELKQLCMRLITLSAMSILGTYYYRVQRRSRHSAGAIPTGRPPAIPTGCPPAIPTGRPQALPASDPAWQ
ncbi:MAG: hypothetical protein AB1894_21970 [Chloroflexota bacterium]